MRRLTFLAVLGFALLVIAPVALAHNDGRGWYGITNDQSTTMVGFILIGFFPLFVLFASLLQWQLEKRKHRRQDAAKAHATAPEWQGGW
jgi:hypothetical protein